ncbi:MAG: hypothetical protein K0R59_248 [Sphingobacterium sp.]|jgi:hypothetical protein|nr:hypothetical protein [Sphingobacterium sp.]
MKTLNKTLAILAIASTALTSCNKDNALQNDSFENRSTAAADYTQSSLPVVTVSGDITSNTTWASGNVYEISGIVTVKSGVTLTIQAGTYIKSTANTVGGTANGVLVIAKGAKINASGTPTNPIVFTSRNLLDGNNATVGKAGDFGGVIILGNARTNEPTNNGSKLIEGLQDIPANYYGSNTDANNAESSGVFRYVRIEYAGYKLSADNEVNGLTLGAVGSGTVLNNVEVAWGLDDGFEFFGGRVNASDLVAFSNDDDQFDFDLGYQGTISNSIAIANKTSSHSASSSNPANSDSNGSEIDNHPTGFTLTPKTKPTFSNVRIIGTEDETGITAPGFKSGVFVRRGAELALVNSKITGYKTGLQINSDATAASTSVQSTSIHGFTLAATAGYNDLGSNTIAPVGAPAPAFGIPQPFFNKAGFNPGLTYTWAKFNY